MAISRNQVAGGRSPLLMTTSQSDWYYFMAAQASALCVSHVRDGHGDLQSSGPGPCGIASMRTSARLRARSRPRILRRNLRSFGTHHRRRRTCIRYLAPAPNLLHAFLCGGYLPAPHATGRPVPLSPVPPPWSPDSAPPALLAPENRLGFSRLVLRPDRLSVHPPVPLRRIGTIAGILRCAAGSQQPGRFRRCRLRTRRLRRLAGARQVSLFVSPRTLLGRPCSFPPLPPTPGMEKSTGSPAPVGTKFICRLPQGGAETMQVGRPLRSKFMSDPPKMS